MKKRPIVLSIRPKWLDKIRSGEKVFELRKVIPDEEPIMVYVYESAPVSRVVGMLDVEEWQNWKSRYDIRTRYLQCLAMTEKDLLDYLGDRCGAWLLRVAFFSPKAQLPTLKDLGLKCPPQNFAYVRKEWFDPAWFNVCLCRMNDDSLRKREEEEIEK